MTCLCCNWLASLVATKCKGSLHMNQLTLHTLALIAFLLSKLGFAYIAYLAVTNRVMYAGWFVFLAVVYALGIGFNAKVD